MQKGLVFSAVSPAVPQSYEYHLVVHPAKEIFEQLKQEKEDFSATYKVSLARKTLPHITVAGFLAAENMEQTLIKWLHKIISSRKRFNVMLNNYSGFPSSKTVYARVQDHEPFRLLAASLQVIDQYIKDNGFPRAIIPAHPHVSIARSLQQQVYEKAIMDYSRKTFNASFMVDELVLLKRQNQYDTCKQVCVFRLGTALN
ncbi:2'-5' RNA ligase family protein [Parafilimonas sp.]|uniref:2'-5' RNA ligase family protein n=1 Tax=Parafilimonas sp. TaxID=1969739 RepID=UPI0039E35038